MTSMKITEKDSMKPDKTAHPAEVRKLADVQSRHPKRLKKVEKARAKLAQASQKLYTLEAEIAVLACAAHDAHLQFRTQTSRKPQNLRQACLIFNPRSKGALNGMYRAEVIVDCLRTYGINADLGLKTSGKIARRLAKEAVDRGVELVVVAAGDGTIEDVVSELVGSKSSLGIIPTGTMNNIARSLGVPLDLEPACALLGMGITRHIDVGRVMPHGTSQVAYFLESAGVGLSALAAPLGQAAEKGRWGMFVHALSKFFAFKGTNVSVACDDDQVFQAHTQVVTVSNAPLLGKNMLVAPDAKVDDGMLDVAVYDGMGKAELERHFMAIADGKRIDDSHVIFRRARRVRVTADEPLKANADLEVLASQQVWAIDIMPGALSVVVGNGMALTLLPFQLQWGKHHSFD
jgi:diacylglycerol kinase (ATP)